MSDVSIGTVGLTVAGWLAGFLSASLLDWRRIVQRRRGLALALREEVRRIRAELGPPGGFSDVQIAGAASVIPQVHPWVHSLLPETANIKPEAFGLFLELDRVLNNMRTFQTQTRELRRRLAEVGAPAVETQPRPVAGAEPPDAVAIDRVVQEVTQRLLVRREQEELRDALGLAVDTFDGAERRARAILDQLDGLLGAYVNRTRLAA